MRLLVDKGRHNPRRLPSHAARSARRSRHPHPGRRHVVPIPELRRLLEYGSPLDAGAAERLVAFGTRMIDISKDVAGRGKAPERSSEV